MKLALSIDIGGTQTRVALIDENYSILERRHFVTNGIHPQSTIDSIKVILESLKMEISCIGVSCPGPLDLKKGIVLTPPNLPGWHNFKLKEEFEKHLGYPTVLENDGNLACLGEAIVGEGKGFSAVQYLTISTGIGAGYVMDEEIVLGAHGFAQEIANMIMWKNGPQHGLLKAGALEAISSGTAIVHRARLAGLDVKHAGEVNELAEFGNQAAREIMDDAKEYLANAIASLIGFGDPDVVVIGGSVALKTYGFVEQIEHRVLQKVYDIQVDNVRIRSAKLGDDSGLIGGAIVAFQEIKKRG